MNFSRVQTHLTAQYICDPYTCLLHCKRTFKFLQQLRQIQQQLQQQQQRRQHRPRQEPLAGLCIGSRHQLHVAWQPHFAGFALQQQEQQHSAATAATLAADSASVLSAAPARYAFILCLDPVLYARHLLNINLPVIVVCSPKELHEYPEILTVTDYLLPAPSKRTDAALRQMLLAAFPSPQQQIQVSSSTGITGSSANKGSTSKKNISSFQR